MIDFDQYQETGRRLLNSRWIFAKTMPDNPHYYTLRREWNDDQFVEVVKFMRKFGYRETYNGRFYTMLIVNQHKYWTMGSPLDKTILINRKPHLLPAAYDRVADDYDRLFSDTPSLKEDREVAGMVAKVDAGGSVLDIGCGTGLLLDMLPDLIGRYTGIDPAIKMLEALTLKYTAARVVHAPFERYVSEQSDLIVSLFGSINYVNPYAVSWIPRSLKPGGRYFLMFYHPQYEPVCYTRTGVSVPHHEFDPETLPGATVTEYHNYLIVTGGGV